MQTQPLGRRIAIFGGGGKTSLADAIARKLGVQHIELDAIQHGPDWLQTPEDEFSRILEQRINESPDGWVIDGNYSHHRPMILAQTDTVIVIQLWFAALFWRILLRCVRRAITREPLWNGNRESIRMTFFSRDSLLLEIIGKKKRYADYATSVPKAVTPGTSVIIIKGTRQLNAFYRTHGLERRLRRAEVA